MTERTYTTMDKSEWGPGPWQNEPDKVSWTDEATGLPCLIVRNRMGGLCGYAGVGPEHPWHGDEYGKHENLDVHGGLTYAADCDDGGDETESICHIPEPGQPDNAWWFGFDCLHAFDLAPRNRELFPDLGNLDKNDEYRDMAYVKAETAKLAQQLAEVNA